MTQRRNDPDRLSNFFDRLLNGIGHRGSSFSDLDAITHDKASGRFLIQEFKQEAEPLAKGQRYMLSAFAEHRSGHFTVWVVVNRASLGDLIWFDWRTKRGRAISHDEYRGRFAAWWANTPYEQPLARPVQAIGAVSAIAEELTVDQIVW